MDWSEIAINTTGEGLEPLCARLVALGFSALMIEEESDLEELINKQQKYWDYIDETLVDAMRGVNRVKLYVRERETPDALALLKAGLEDLRRDLPDTDFGLLGLEVEGKNEAEWALAWQKYYRPTPVGERVLIVPEWEKDYDAAGRIVFLNNPGMSFGTGSHASTRLCIEALEREIKPDNRILDLGCGSGILSIIGLLLGGGQATAVDIDEAAVDIARRNAQLNGIDLARYAGFAGDILEDSQLRTRLLAEKYDIVLANIVADVILAILPVVPDLLKKGGVFIASGIIDTRRDEIAEGLLKHGFRPVREDMLDGWCAFTASLFGEE